MEKTLQNSPSRESLYEVADLLSPYIDSLKLLVESAVESLQSSEKSDLQRPMTMIADRLSRLISIVTLVNRECSASQEKFPDLKAIEIHLLSVLKAVQSAEKADDRTMLSDLLEYELQDNLTQWKIKAIPQIKRRILA